MSTRTVALPTGFRITLDRGTREVAPGVWSGGSPARVIRLTPNGRAVWQRLSAGAVDSRAAGTLARRLTDAGLAHPCPPPVAPGAVDVTIVIPVRDRATLLDRCIAALDGRYQVVVVDDGSRAPAAVAAVAAAHGARLVVRPANGGPGAARNTGLDHVTTDLVAFVDSDCVPSRDWIERLAGHFADPMVAAAAPRVTAIAGAGVAGRYARVAGSLDMGRQPAGVVPNTRVSYVPTVALIARRRALLAVARPAGVFDSAMPVGEDVDLVWRLHDGGWRIRYDPAVRVGHHEPTTWGALLGRRLRYGTSAAPLAQRHPGKMSPLVLYPGPAAIVAALLTRRPVAAVAAFALAVRTTNRTLRARDLPVAGAVRMNAINAGKTWLGTGRYAGQYGAPVLLGLMLAGGRARWGRRAVLASLLVGPPLATWIGHRPPIDPVRFTAAALADDIAYGAGVWAGCVKHRTTTPLRPTVGRRAGERGTHERRREATAWTTTAHARRAS